jgi:hypothetical protein
MKRLFFVASIVACLAGFSSFANENVPDALQSFYKTFQGAKSVNWTKVDDMLRIGFIMDGHQKFAYYSNDELVVLASEIKTEELPEIMKAQLSAYEGYTVSQAYELTKNDVTEYCVVIQNGSKRIILKGKNKWKTLVGARF